jgi:hypothetical protein
MGVYFCGVRHGWYDISRVVEEQEAIQGLGDFAPKLPV